MKTPDFTPAEGVTFDNALRYIEAIEEAVKEGAHNLSPSDMSMMVGIIAGAMRLVADRLGEFRAELEASGEALPPTEEQLLQLRMIFRRAREKGLGN